MSKKNKLLRFAKLAEFENVYQNFEFKNPALISHTNEIVKLNGMWNKNHFKNEQPLILELACGGGEYTVALAKHYPENNYIGVDIKGARIFKGAKIALEEKIRNAAFLRTRIELIDHFFDQKEVNEIWITFPDPFLKSSDSNKRLTSPRFLNLYRRILAKDHIIHLKTDSKALYDFTMETIAEDPNIELIFNNDNIYAEDLQIKALDIKTYYEKKHLSNNLTIKYIKFKLI